MICRKCKREPPSDALYCPWCGLKLQPGKHARTRGNGQGCVFRRGKTWTAQITTGYKAGKDSKLRRVTRSKGGFKTKKDALDYIPQLRNPAPATMTLAQVYEAWSRSYPLSPSGEGIYHAAWNYLSELAPMRIDQIQIDDLQAVIDGCPRGSATKTNIRNLAGLLLKYAIPRHLASVNIAQYIRITSDQREKPGIPISELPKLERDDIGAQIVLCHCYLGFRPSELLALTDADYDGDKWTLRGGAKTDAGKDRLVTIPPKVQPIVDRLAGRGYIFSVDGKRMTVPQYAALFYKVLDRCGIENPVRNRSHLYTPHSCRHTFATLLKHVPGADKDKMRLIGHASAEMLRYYQDVDLADLRRITDQMR